MLTFYIKNLLRSIFRNFYVFIITLIALNSIIFYFNRNFNKTEHSIIIKPNLNSINTVYLNNISSIQTIFYDSLSEMYFLYNNAADKKNHIKQFLRNFDNEKFVKLEIIKLIDNSKIWIDTDKREFIKITILSSESTSDLMNFMIKAFKSEIFFNIRSASQKKNALIQKINSIKKKDTSQVNVDVLASAFEFISYQDFSYEEFDKIFLTFIAENNYSLLLTNKLYILLFLSIIISIGVSLLFNEFYFASKKKKS